MKTNLQIPANKKTGLLYPDLSYELVGLCYSTHNEVGTFGREKQYADLFEKKLQENGIRYRREVVIGSTGNIADFIIENKIAFEFKAKHFFQEADFAQMQRYLQTTGLELGILVNFGGTFVRSERVLRIDKPNNHSDGRIGRYS